IYRCRLPAVSTSATATAAAAVAISTASATTTATRFTRRGFVNLDVAALELGAVERLDRGGGFAGIRHFDEAETLGLAGELVGDNRDALDGAGLGEEVFQ